MLMASKRDTLKRQKAMRERVAAFQKYVGTYHEQAHYEDYLDKTYVDDMLYGIGLSMSGLTDYSGPGGYERFKQYLREHLDGKRASAERADVGG
jgi:hypothetical protein